MSRAAAPPALAAAPELASVCPDSAICLAWFPALGAAWPDPDAAAPEAEVRWVPNGPDDVRGSVRSWYDALADAARRRRRRRPGGVDPERSRILGYDPGELAAVPRGANLGLGCGDPFARAALRPGETVLDLGSGAGLDGLLAARRVGPEGRVIGVDFAPSMIARARRHAAQLGAANLEFRLGKLEHLPVDDASIDVVLSNHAVSLSPEHAAVCREAFRVLRAGGRLALAEVVALSPLPPERLEDLAAATGGAAAVGIAELERAVTEAGFEDVRLTVDPRSRDFIRSWLPGSGLEDALATARVEARRPRAAPSGAPPPRGPEDDGPR